MCPKQGKKDLLAIRRIQKGKISVSGRDNISDKKPINDTIEHMSKIEGYLTDAELNKLPVPLRYFGHLYLVTFLYRYYLS